MWGNRYRLVVRTGRAEFELQSSQIHLRMNTLEKGMNLSLLLQSTVERQPTAKESASSVTFRKLHITFN